MKSKQAKKWVKEGEDYMNTYEDLNYNWTPYLSLGFTREFLKQAETEWAEGILEYITDRDLVDDFCTNVELLLDKYTYEETFLFLMHYPSSFSMSPEVFSERLAVVKQALGSDWDE